MRIALGLATLLASFSAYSATVTQCGPNICYEYDNSQVAASAGFFGTPTLIGDDMRFLPTTFKAQSTDGVGINTGTNTDTYGSTFVFDRIYTVSGDEIANITYTERGDYAITNDGTVQANLLMLVANNSDAAECDCVLDSFSDAGANALTTWELNSSFDAAVSFESLANDVSLSLQNNLSAFTDASGEDAFVQKKFMTVTVTAVPVPAAVWLLGSGIGMLALRARRRG